jgi:hypothetical protein
MITSFRNCKTSWKCCAAFIVLLLLTGCSASKKPQKGREGLLAAVESFNSLLRWEDYRLASSWIPQNDKEMYWGIADLFQGRLRIMEYQIRDISVAPDGASGSVFLSFRFYFTNDPNLLSRTIHQKWVFSDEKQSWVVTTHDLEGLLEDNEPATNSANG